MNDLTDLTLTETLEALDNKKISEEELNRAYQQKIDNLNPILNAYLYICQGSSGIPYAVKDVIVTEGIPTTAGSKILEGFIPPYNATVIERLSYHNLRIIGKTNCDEFAMGSSGENSAYGPTKNPWNLNKVPGGSSSGSAVAVSAGLCSFALGTDTGGSIRQPASLCGVVGLKPSYGRVSRYGSIAMASSLDQIGPITKSVADARLILSWIQGEDGYDNNAVSYSNIKSQTKKSDNLSGIKIGVPKEYFGKGLDTGVESAVKKAISKMEELGGQIIDISLPCTEYAIATYYILMPSEVSSNMARFDGIRFGTDRDNFGQETKRRIMIGTYVLSSGYYEDYFIKAAKVRTLIKQDFERAFEKCDVIVGPVSPTTAWNLGAKMADPLAMYLSDAYTVPASLAGIPSISLPCGFSDGLPVGLQILGKYLDEEKILTIAEVYEQSTEWHKMKPTVDMS